MNRETWIRLILFAGGMHELAERHAEEVRKTAIEFLDKMVEDKEPTEERPQRTRELAQMPYAGLIRLTPEAE